MTATRIAADNFRIAVHPDASHNTFLGQLESQFARRSGRVLCSWKKEASSEHGRPWLGDLLVGQNLVLEQIARGESLHQVLDTLLRVIQLQCPGMLASILLLDPDGSHVRHGAAPDLPEDYVRAIDGLPIGPQAVPAGRQRSPESPSS